MWQITDAHEENSSGTKTAVNTFGPTGLLARTSTTRTLLYTFDPQGNVCQQVDAGSGATVATYLFDSYGSRVFSSSDNAATSEPYTGFGGMHGYVTDWETGLQLLTHRYFDPSAGRFLTRDPIHYEGGINLYEYCGNSPTATSDGLGLMDWGKMLECLKKADRGIECLSTLIKVLIQEQTQSPPCVDESWCKFALNCIADGIFMCLCELGLEALEDTESGGSAELTPISAIVNACICGALEGAIHYAVDLGCQNNNPCGEPPEEFNVMCLFQSVAAGVLSGCFGGGLSGKLGDSMGSIILRLGASLGLDLGADAMCKGTPPTRVTIGYPNEHTE